MPGERRTLLVTIIAGAMMLVEVYAGLVFGSMALLADGLHMASHATALAVAYAAYVFARRYARDRRFSFGTGKVNSLAGFSGALLLSVFAVLMAWESLERFLSPVPIRFNQAIAVAVVGLIVNTVSAVILSHRSGGTRSEAEHAGHSHHHDHNLRAAYLHVLADALTSVLAIGALLAGKLGGANWLDPAMGIVGSLLVARWSIGLIRMTGAVLLDRQAPDELCESVRRVVEQDGSARVTDLHIWSIGPRCWSAAIAIAAADGTAARHCRARLLAAGVPLAHLTIQVDPSAD